jgi:predicted secreted protein
MARCKQKLSYCLSSNNHHGHLVNFKRSTEWIRENRKILESEESKSEKSRQMTAAIVRGKTVGFLFQVAESRF